MNFINYRSLITKQFMKQLHRHRDFYSLIDSIQPIVNLHISYLVETVEQFVRRSRS